jgi:hypothetical protein
MLPWCRRLLDYLTLLVAGMAGYLGGPGWLLLFAAAALSIEDCVKLWLQTQSGVPIRSKPMTYVVTGAISNLGYSALCYVAGAIVRLAA